MFGSIPPLAWLQLTREKTRLLVALAGIAFAVILMLMQLGFRDALFDTALRVHQRLKGDIFLLNSQSLSLVELKEFSQKRLYQSLGLPEVESVGSVYLGYGSWKNPQTGRIRSLMTIGIDPEDNILDLPTVEENLNKIREADVVLFDSASRPEFGDIGELLRQKPEVPVEIEDRRVTVKGLQKNMTKWDNLGKTSQSICQQTKLIINKWLVLPPTPMDLVFPNLNIEKIVPLCPISLSGLFEMGASFGSDGTVITSDINFIRLFDPQRTNGLIDLGAIALKPNASVNKTIKKLQKSLPDDIQVLSKAEFIKLEKSYWGESTAIGFIFTLGTIMGFVVGIVIVDQILYADVTDQMVEYATLKAIGYSDLFLSTLVFQEAVILSVLGFIPGFALCLGLYDNAKEGSGLPLAMTLERGLTVFLLTILMCIISGIVAMRKTQSADPADIF